jgi:hypothetical protein
MLHDSLLRFPWPALGVLDFLGAIGVAFATGCSSGVPARTSSPPPRPILCCVKQLRYSHALNTQRVRDRDWGTTLDHEHSHLSP